MLGPSLALSFRVPRAHADDRKRIARSTTLHDCSHLTIASAPSAKNAL
jgi:hypothetical protein